jgi:hypothetical protein
MRFLTTLFLCLFYTVLATNMRSEDTALASRSILSRFWDSLISVFKGKPKAAAPKPPQVSLSADEQIEIMRKRAIEDGFISG